MNMSITYWLSFEDMDRCFKIWRKGTVFEKEPAYITAYEACKGLNDLYASKDRLYIPLRDAQTGKRFIECATSDNIDKMIKWLREEHDIFYIQAINLCIPLEDPLSRNVKKFWEEEDAQQKQIEDYCKNDPACGLSLKKLHNRYVAHHTPPITYSFPLDKPIGRVTGAHIGQPGEGIRIDIELFDKKRAEGFIEDLWRLISDEPVPEIKNASDQIDFYNKVCRTVVKYKNELLNLRKDNDTLSTELRELRSDHDTLTESYARLWEDKERKKRMLNSYYGATCGATADAYGEIQRLKKERDELKERLDNLEGGGYACSGCHRTTCGYFAEILSSLGIKNAYVTSGRRGSMSIVEAYAKAANERAKAIFSEHQRYQEQIDKLNERIHNQEQIIKTQSESLTKQRKQLKDLGVALRNVKDVTDSEMDDLMKNHGDDIIPVF